MELLIGLCCTGLYIIIGSLLKELYECRDGEDSIMICFWPIIVPIMAGISLCTRAVKAGEKLAKIIKNIKEKTK
jgi:hypothetical protein